MSVSKRSLGSPPLSRSRHHDLRQARQNLRPGAKEEIARTIIAAFLKEAEATEGMIHAGKWSIGQVYADDRIATVFRAMATRMAEEIEDGR